MQESKTIASRRIGMTVVTIVVVALLAIVCWRVWGASGQDSVSAASGEDLTTQPIESVASPETPQE